MLSRVGLLLMSLVMVMLGGAIGSGLRYMVSQWLPTAAGTLPLSTLLVNAIGSGLLGALTVLASRYPMRSPELTLLLGGGLCGGFTTFSTVTVEVLMLAENDRVGLGMLYALLSLVLGVLTAIAGASVTKVIMNATA